MYYYIKTYENDIIDVNDKRLFITDFDCNVGDYITVGELTYKVSAVEHVVGLDGKYKGTCIHVKERQTKNIFK